MTRWTIRRAAVSLLLSSAGVLVAQPGTGAPAPAFDAASLKALPEGSRGGRRMGGPGTSDPGRFSWNAPLRILIALAYGVDSRQVTGPEWMSTAIYSVATTMPSGADQAQFRGMLQTLLAERLHLAVHRVTRTLDGYDLTVAKAGFKLKEDDGPPAGLGQICCTAEMGPAGVTLTFRGAAMGMLVSDLSRRLGQGTPAGPSLTPIEDKTGLIGRYSFTLRYARDGSDAPGDDLPGALERQLGLKLIPRQVPVEFVAVDRVDKTPLEN